MQQVNYITQLQESFSRMDACEYFTPYHGMLYIALFQYWNACYFFPVFPLKRTEIMQKARIGSKSTFYKCLKDLHKYGFLEYQASNNREQHARIKMQCFSGCINGNDIGSDMGTNNKTYKSTSNIKQKTVLYDDLRKNVPPQNYAQPF